MRLPIILSVLTAGALISLTACGGREVETTPLPGSFLSCQAAELGGKTVYCDPETRIAVTYLEEAAGPEGPQRVDQYFLVPLKVASPDDWRRKRDLGWKLSLWKERGIDLCRVKVWVEPGDLILELEGPEDFLPPGCP